MTNSSARSANGSSPNGTGAVRSKSIQSLGWIDSLLGDKKARREAEAKAKERGNKR